MSRKTFFGRHVTILGTAVHGRVGVPGVGFSAELISGSHRHGHSLAGNGRPPSMERELHAQASWPGVSRRVPAVHVFARRAKDVVGPHKDHKGGHDVWGVAFNDSG